MQLMGGWGLAGLVQGREAYLGPGQRRPEEALPWPLHATRTADPELRRGPGGQVHTNAEAEACARAWCGGRAGLRGRNRHNCSGVRLP